MSVSNERVRSGLFTNGGAAVPLAGVSAEIDVSGLCARVQITQRYRNTEAVPLETVYVFPLDEAAALCGFDAVVDGRTIVGQVVERDAAFESYDEALAAGHGAFLLEQERPDVFTASVGNLTPGSEVLLRLTYVTELEVEDGSFHFVLPTTVAPRYAPAVDLIGGRHDVERVTPPVAWRVPYGLTIRARFARASAPARVESPSHPIRVEWLDGRTQVTLAQDAVALDRDFVLSADVDGLDAPSAWIERGEDGTHAVAVAFRPMLPDSTEPSELVFLIDRSGSMGGSSIDEVRRALRLCLRSMVPGCRFNFVGFGSSFEALFPSSRPYDDASLAAADAHLDAMSADMGGTEILPALRFALDDPGDASLRRQVIVLTDGHVTNTESVLSVARDHADRARVFTFGIGAGASHHLVRGLARAGRGHCELIHPGEPIESKIVRQFTRLCSPSVDDIRVDWHGRAVTQVPAAVPAIFSGGRLLVYALAPSIEAGTVSLTATLGSTRLNFDIELDPAAAIPGTTVATLAARQRIRELSEAPDPADRRGSRQRTGRHGREEIVTLSKRFRLISPYTSFVAVERREQTQIVRPLQLRRVPVALTTGWGGVGMSGPPVPVALAAPPPSPASGHFADVAPAAGLADRVRRGFRALARVQRAGPPPPAAPLPVSPGARVKSLMHMIVVLQRADGSWELSRELADALRYDLATLEAEAPLQTSTGRRAWATALAIAWLTLRAAEYADEWRLIARKARAWLSHHGGPAADTTTHAAERLLDAGPSTGNIPAARQSHGAR